MKSIKSQTMKGNLMFSFYCIFNRCASGTPFWKANDMKAYVIKWHIWSASMVLSVQHDPVQWALWLWPVWRTRRDCKIGQWFFSCLLYVSWEPKPRVAMQKCVPESTNDNCSESHHQCFYSTRQYLLDSVFQHPDQYNHMLTTKLIVVEHIH